MRIKMLPTLVLTAACAACAQTPPPAPAPVAAAPAPAPAPAMPPRPMGPMPKMAPPSHSASSVPSGTYMIEPAHTQVMFSVVHFGTSTYYGSFANASGELVVDARNPAADTLNVSVPVNSVYTTSPRLTDELKSAPWLDANAYPAMTFKSTRIIPTGKTSAKVMGDLTLHGVTKPVTLYASFMASGMNPMMHKLNFGFTVTGTIKRSDFGVSTAVPMVSDDTKLIISAAFTE